MGSSAGSIPAIIPVVIKVKKSSVVKDSIQC